MIFVLDLEFLIDEVFFLLFFSILFCLPIFIIFFGKLEGLHDLMNIDESNRELRFLI